MSDLFSSRSSSPEEGEICPHCPRSPRVTYKKLANHIAQRHLEKSRLFVILTYADSRNKSDGHKVYKKPKSDKNNAKWVYRCPGLDCDKPFTRRDNLKGHWRKFHAGLEVSPPIMNPRAFGGLSSEKVEVVDDGDDAEYVDRPRTYRKAEKHPPQVVVPSASTDSQPHRGSRSKPQKSQKYVIEFLESISKSTSERSGSSHDYVQYASVFEGLGMETREDFETMIKYGPGFVDQIGTELRKVGLLPFRWLVIKEELRQRPGGFHEQT